MSKLVQGTKCAILENRSTATRMLVFPAEVGRSVIKDTVHQGTDGLGNGSKSPTGSSLTH